MRSFQVTFDLPDAASERPFLRTYMVPAWERFEARDCFDCGWFWPFGDVDGPVELDSGLVVDDGGVVLVVNGDPTPEPLVESERPRWDDLEERGVIRGRDEQWFDPEYEHARAKAVENFGEVGGDRAYRLRPLVARLTLDTLAAFDERPPAVGEATGDNPRPIGFWATIHYLMKQQGFDWQDEVDACTKAIRNRLRSLAHFEGDAAAREELAAVRADLADAERELGL